MRWTGFAQRDTAKAFGALVAGGHRPKEFLNWPRTELQLATRSAMALEAWRLKQLAKALGGRKGPG